MVASLVGLLGDMDLAEEAAQEAFAIASERWPRKGAPQHPVAWLVATGRNRAIDRVRRERMLQDKTRLLEADHAAATMGLLTACARTAWRRCSQSCTSSSIRATPIAAISQPRRSGWVGCWPS